MKKSTTKRALLSSVLALVMCFGMLTGTTFAWFTDTVTSGSNVIAAGNLDVELYNGDARITGDVTQDPKLFNDVEDGKWEPGAMAWETFTVKNEGTLALKYALSFNVTAPATDKSLAPALKIAYIEGELTNATTRINPTDYTWHPFETFVLNGDLNLTVDAEKADTYTFIVWWEPSDNDNDFNRNNDRKNDQASIGFNLVLKATQLNSESDAFGPDYDFDAEYDENNSSSTTPPVLYVNTAAELAAALAPTISDDKATIVLNADITLADGETWTPLDLEAYSGNVRNIVIDGQGHFIAGLDAPLIGNCYFGNTSVEIKNLTLKNSNIVDKYYNGLGSGAFVAYADNSHSVVFDNCHLVDSTITATGDFTGIGGLIGYSSSPLTITNCSVTNCTITGAQNSAGAIAGHVSAGYDTTITNAKVVGCTVKGERADKTGYVVGTANTGATVITTDAACANNTIFDVADSTTVYGRLAGGTLTINGVAQ